MGEEVIDAGIERGEPLLGGSREPQQRQQHRRGIGFEHAADHGSAAIRIDREDDQVRRTTRHACDDFVVRNDIVDHDVGAFEHSLS